MKIVSAETAAQQVRSLDTVYVHSVAGAPQRLLTALVARAPELKGVHVVNVLTLGDAPYAAPEVADSFRTSVMFVGPNVRAAVEEGRAEYIPVFLSDVPKLFRRGVLPLDVALVQVSPPDRHGFCSLGVAVDASRAAVETAKTVIAQVNPRMPRTHGDSLLHVTEIDFGVEVDEPLAEAPDVELTDAERAIGRNCAELIEDGACMQMGIGAIPDAVWEALSGHQDLGIHTEMFAPRAIDLVEKGVITGRKKKTHPGKIVSSFLIGNRRLYDFVDDNPLVLMLDVEYTNDTAVIRRNPKVAAVNSAIEVDLTGQVVADSIGTRQFSGVGGQMDFVRGAALSEGGKPIIALPSVTGKGASRIVPLLQPGAGVVTTRAHVHFVVTEHGVAHLYGKDMRARARALIAIAHPDHREALERAALSRFHRL